MSEDLPEVPEVPENGTEEKEITALTLIKSRVGLSSQVRDTYLTAILNGVLSELEKVQGLLLDMDNPHHLMFAVDLATWRYQNRDQHGAMPRHLQFRLHNLMIHTGGGASDV